MLVCYFCYRIQRNKSEDVSGASMRATIALTVVNGYTVCYKHINDAIVGKPITEEEMGET